MNSPVLPRDLGLQTFHRPSRTTGEVMPVVPPLLVPPLVPPGSVPPESARVNPSPTPKDNAQVYAGESGFGGVPPLIRLGRDDTPGEATPKAPPPPRMSGAGVGEMMSGTLGTAAASAAALLSAVAQAGTPGQLPGVPEAAAREASSKSGPDRITIGGPPAKTRGGPWLDTRTELVAQHSTIVPGMVLKAWVVPQPKLKKSFDAAAPACFYVLERGPITDRGLDVNVHFLGAKTVKCASALAESPLKPGNPTALHLCTSSRCASSKKNDSQPGVRMHSMAFQVVYPDEVKERFCEAGVKRLTAILSSDSRYPRPVARPSVMPPTGEALRRVEALSAELGPPNRAGLLDGGFFGPSGNQSLSLATAQAQPLELPQVPRIEETRHGTDQTGGKVDALLTQLSELLASRVAAENETAQLKRQFSDQQAQTASLVSELNRQDKGTVDPATAERAKVDHSPTPPAGHKKYPFRNRSRRSRRSSQGRERTSDRRSGKSGREKRSRRKEQTSKSARRGRSPLRDRRQSAESDRDRSRGRHTRRAPSPQGAAGLPSPGRDIPHPSMRVPGITHAVAGGDIAGRNSLLEPPISVYAGV